jgi:subtilisin-like proprotein convertase family protein
LVSSFHIPVRLLFSCSLAAVAVGATACSLDVSFAQSAYRCDDGVSCPVNFECVAQMCVSTAATDAPDANVEPPPDGTPVGDSQTAHAWKDDSPGDFGAGRADHTTVSARGAIEPYAYYTGGVLQRASDTGQIGDPATATWADVQAFPMTGHESLTRGAEIDWGSGTPAGVGLTRSDFSMTFEGEIRLDAGTWTFQYNVDDKGFLEIADASGNFGRVAHGDWSTPGSGTFVAPATGWYPIRWALTDTGGLANVKVSVQGPGVSSMTPVPRDRLRARVDQHPGLVMSGFDDKLLLGNCATTIDATAPTYVDWGNGLPADLGISVPDFYSVRWSGQLRVDVAGDYAFRYTSDDGQRLWIDGQQLLGAWDESYHDQVSAPVTLSVGWHDLVVDVSESYSAARAKVKVESGPDLVGSPLPVDRLRPVEGRAERFVQNVNHTDYTIPDLGTAQSQLTLVAPAGATVSSIDVSYTFDHTYTGDLVFTLVAPNGATRVLRNRTGQSATTDESDFYDAAFLVGAPVAGVWTLRVQDKQAQDTGILRDFQILVHYAGGEAPIATSAAYESPVRDLGTVAAYDAVTWDARTPSGTSVAVRLRSCDSADCAGQVWSDPLPDPTGSFPTLVPRRYLQYRVELGSQGDQAASLESIELDYRTSDAP